MLLVYAGGGGRQGRPSFVRKRSRAVACLEVCQHAMLFPSMVSSFSLSLLRPKPILPSPQRWRTAQAGLRYLFSAAAGVGMVMTATLLIGNIDIHLTVENSEHQIQTEWSRPKIRDARLLKCENASLRVWVLE